ncbi:MULTISPECIES: PP2C family serine/threonine-protein phosphatase [Pseudomonas]|uniref:PP2C family protein-serine/threonine phosphatase n=1 Tax=Pseudomonas TaxID=286 RepID=UPI001AE69AB0|nr:PP2C family serine/threonine-protein phosphatase [Pseudomonas sp. PvP006]MBP1124063.1 serine/threonine-protein phosphatase Stp1 [Pseudomonas sp. PvP025]MDQ0397923.1 serine/threonine-protein phosphatase Stp1 [Pseudomonas sp. PvP006]
MSQAPARWRSAGHTLCGKDRSRNEDALLDCPERGCWAVADGMGGHRAGDVASQWVVSSLASMAGHGDLDQRVGAVRCCLQEVNRKLRHTAQGPHDIIGSTVVALLLEGDRAACVWAGDSRCYLWRGRRLYLLSRDHSRMRQLMEEHRMSAQQAGAQPDARALTRAVGARERLHLEVLELGTRPGDVFLLCSDGVYQALDHGELGQALSLDTPQQMLDRVFESVLCGAARDDLTAVVIQR